MFVGNQPLSSDPPDVTTDCGADCYDDTKNKTRKNILGVIIISEKNQYQKDDVFMCVLHHYEKRVTNRETRV